MFDATSLRRHLAELVAVFVGVALAFAVENLRESLNERAVGEQYLSGFREDLTADRAMLQAQLEARQRQLQYASTVLEFFDGRAIDPTVFFEAFYPALRSLNTIPNRNTMDEVLSSGNLRLIRDPEIRSDLLSLYATYEQIELLEAHMARDFDAYLYDPTFSSIAVQVEGPYADTAERRQAIETLLGDVRIENGFRLIGFNLHAHDGGLFDELESARSQVEHLLQVLPAD